MHIHLGTLVLVASGLAITASAQEAVPESGAGWTGITDADEIIEARRVLMIQIEEQMRPIDAFADGVSIDPTGLEAAAATIEAMLLAFPHLFPPTTDLYDPAVLEPPTYALPEIWQDFAGFRALALAAETAAAAVVESEDASTLRAAGRDLRATCEGCHSRFTKPYTPPVVTEEDLEFDFESVFPER